MPGPFPSPSAVICGDGLHVIGSDTNGYSCSLQEILQHCQPISQPPLHSVSHTSVWIYLPTLPQTDSTAATLCGELVAIGGGFGESPVNFIHQIVGQKWVDVTGMMSTGRRRCLVANESPENLWQQSCLHALCIIILKVQQQAFCMRSCHFISIHESLSSTVNTAGSH